MSFLVLSSVLAFGGILAAFGLFENCDDGDDTLAIAYGANGAGVAGNDTLILSPISFGGIDDGGTIEATGGTGQDIFAINMVVPGSSSTVAPMVITDFNPDLDRLLVEVTGVQPSDYLYDRATITPNISQGYTDVTLHWRSLLNGAPDQTSQLRLLGGQSLDPADIELTSSVDPFDQLGGLATTPAVGGVIDALPGDGPPDPLPLTILRV